MARSRDTSKFEDLEALRQRFQEFRKANRPRTRLPEELWNAAVEIAGRRGVGLMVRTLRLDVNNLKKRMGNRFLRRDVSAGIPPEYGTPDLVLHSKTYLFKKVLKRRR